MDLIYGQFELMLRGLAAGAMVVTAMGLWLSDAPRNARVAALLFCLSITGYVLINAAPLHTARGVGPFLVNMGAYTVTAFVWLFVLVLFEDRKVSPLTLAPAAVMAALGAYGLMGECNRGHWVWTVRDIGSVLLAGHGLYVIVRGWRGDLVEARRALRGPFLAVSAGFALLQSLLDGVERFGIHPPWGGFGNACIMTVLCLTGAYIFLQAKGTLFGAPKAASPPDPSLGEADQQTLTRLALFMEHDEGWRRESLTFGDVAKAVAVPDHRLRRLINDHMGHRNFQAFVNAYRIEAAKQALAAPEQARTTIAAVAFDLGFGSLGPFNRAFREATGQSPREWRRQLEPQDQGP
jgi:AraC-like DNA-binding protein